MMTDVFSKVSMAVPTHDQRAETVAQALVEEWFYKFGLPGRIHSDQALGRGTGCLVCHR